MEPPGERRHETSIKKYELNILAMTYQDTLKFPKTYSAMISNFWSRDKASRAIFQDYNAIVKIFSKVFDSWGANGSGIYG